MSMKSKKKIFCLALAAVFTFSMLSANYQASAMFGIDPGYDGDIETDFDYDLSSCAAGGTRVSANRPDSHGWTPLTRAIQEGNVSKVRKLLKQDVDLSILPLGVRGRYKNVLEFIYDMSVAYYKRKDALIHPFFSDAVREGYERISDMILEYCVKHKKKLNINSDMIKDQPYDTRTLWDIYGRYKYFDYVDAHPDLFTFSPGAYTELI